MIVFAGVRYVVLLTRPVELYKIYVTFLKFGLPSSYQNYIFLHGLGPHIRICQPSLTKRSYFVNPMTCVFFYSSSMHHYKTIFLRKEGATEIGCRLLTASSVTIFTGRPPTPNTAMFRSKQMCNRQF